MCRFVLTYQAKEKIPRRRGHLRAGAAAGITWGGRCPSAGDWVPRREVTAGVEVPRQESNPTGGRCRGAGEGGHGGAFGAAAGGYGGGVRCCGAGDEVSRRGGG